MAETADQIAAAIVSLQAQRDLLGDAAVDLAIAALNERLALSWPASPDQLANADPQLKQVTVLFVDVVGSTTMGSQLDPEDLHLLVDGALRRLSAIVTAHRGRVLQYAGDNLLAVFGYGTAHEDDPENAVHAGLAVIDEARRLARQAQQSHGLDGFNVRVGAHTGAVLLGAGVDGEDSVRGSTVNIAARMEQTAPRGSFRISQDCHHHVRGLFDVSEQAPLTVKGMDKPLQTYLVQRARQRSFQPARRGVGDAATRMVDRVEESEQLRNAYRTRCAAGRAELVALFLVGDAGIGKTRLLTEFSDWAARQPQGMSALTARATERRKGQPYGLLRDLLSSNLPLLDSDPAAQACAKWLTAMAPMLESAADAAVLGHLLGLDFSAHEAVRGIVGEARQIRDRGYHYASQVLAKAAGTGPPLLLLLDDLQWADDGSLDFIEHLSASHDDLPLLLVSLMRPTLYERRPAWHTSAGRHALIELTQLDARYSEELADALLERLDETPRELHELIVDRAEGNPYYMEELVNMLIDQGAIVVAEPWHVQPEKLLGARVPTTLTGVLQARVDALPSELRLTLQHAAVVGHVFWDDALGALGAHPESALQELIVRQIIQKRAASSLAGKREYSFKHQTLHRVCYDSVLKLPKRAAHAKVALWLAAQPGAAHLDLIAEHFEQGGDVPKAIVYWQRAAEAAASRYANAAALAHAQRALDLVLPGDLPADLARRYALCLLIAKVLRTQSERTRLALCLDELATLADRLGNDALRSEAAERRARFLSDGGDSTAALRVAQQALAWAPDDAPECAARAHLLIASALSTLGRPDAALPHAGAGLAAARKAGNPAVEAMMLNQMGMDANNRGDPGAAIDLFEQALTRHREANNRSNEAGTLSNMAYAAFVLGDYAAAHAQFLQAGELCRQVGQRQSEGIVHINLALVLQCQGDASGARQYARSALELLRQAGDRLGQAAALRVAGHAELMLGEPASAGDHFSASRELFDELGLRHLAVEAITGLALLALAGNDVGAALQHVEVILNRQADGASLAGTDEPLRIGLVGHQVLAAAGDARADRVLAATHAELQARAEKISDPARREAFLDNVPWHRELVRLWAVRSGA